MTSAPEPTLEPGAWNRELANAFEVLLGKPLDAYPATAEYALFTWNDEVSYLMYEDLLSGAVDMSVDESDEPDESGEPDELVDEGEHGSEQPQFDWDLWPTDHERSVWLIDEGAPGADGALGEAIHTALRAVSVAYDSRRAVFGADLARVLAVHGLPPGEVDPADAVGMVQWLQRVRTGGTLFDAMRAATWTTGGPGALVPFEREAEVEPAMEQALRRVSHPRLRDHLRMLCLTAHWARSDGGYYLGPGECPNDLRWIAEQPGHEVVAGWEFGEGQASSAVFKIK
ncbi:hypothetical protein [Streptomyces sp. NPDC005953]|uniref:hypothetical protein n=1 Tax=Streptomyces sp. NPDC005953 TaxID=3156719 RepID=UPI0033EFBE10